MFSFYSLKYFVNKTSCYMLLSSQGTVGFPAAAGSQALLLKHKYVCRPQGSKSLTSKTLRGCSALAALIQFQTHTTRSASTAASRLSVRVTCPLNATQRLLHLQDTAVCGHKRGEKPLDCEMFAAQVPSHGPAAVPRERCFLCRLHEPGRLKQIARSLPTEGLFRGYTFPPCHHGFSPGSPASSDNPKTCRFR